MALSSDTVWEVRTTGSDSNGGGFVTGASGTDYSQQSAAQKSGADLAIHASDNTKVQPVAAGVAAADIGNLIQITAGTGFTTGFYEITAQDGTYWTLDRAAGTVGSTGGTYAMGGALASIGAIGGVIVSGNLVFIKYGSYTQTTATINVSGGSVQTGSNISVTIIGYDTTRTAVNKDANRPTITLNAGVTVATMFRGFDRSRLNICNLILDGALQTTSQGTYLCNVVNCKASNFTNSAFRNSFTFGCEAVGCTTQGSIYEGLSYFSVAHDNSVAGFYACTSICCLSYSNTTYGFQSPSSESTMGCVAYDNSSHGYYSSGRTTCWVNCIAENNGGYGFADVQSYRRTRTINCATYNNTSGATSNTDDQGMISGSGSFFTNAASDDFSLNNTAGAGAACRTAGYPDAFPQTVSLTNNIDIGAVQHPDAGGGLLTHPGMRGGVRG